MNSPISTPFLSQKTALISFLADVCLNFLACLANVCAFTALTAALFRHSQIKARFYHLLFIWRDWEIHRHLCCIALKKSKLKRFSAFCSHPWAFLELVIAQPNCDTLVENTASNLWNLTWKFLNCEAQSLINFLVNTLNKIITHYRWTPDHFALHRDIRSPTFEHSPQLSYSSFTLYILAVNRAKIVMVWDVDAQRDNHIKL
jgi:hypothetical protein